LASENAVQFMQSWYQAQCNGVWEHSNGVTIETLATPGWHVTIDLAETALEGRTMREFTARRSERDWIVCKVEHSQFRGEGDPNKLAAILHIFETFASPPATVK
jgi:hypothetical protein